MFRIKNWHPTLFALICCFANSGSALAQAPTPAPRQQLVSSPSTTGRYQLLAQPEGQVFMIDSATGRVWRYTKVAANDQQIQNYLDTLIRIEEQNRSTPFTAEDKKNREAALRVLHANDIESLANPCNGLTICFVELDRVNLNSKGAFVSEVVK